MKRNRHQVTCNCSAYDFPHRFGSGRCDGMALAEQHCGGQLCISCPAYLGSEGGCDVLRGSEDPKNCEYVIEFCEYHEIKLK